MSAREMSVAIAREQWWIGEAIAAKRAGWKAAGKLDGQMEIKWRSSNFWNDYEGI